LATLSAAYRCFRNLAVTESPSDVETDAESVFSAANSESSVSSFGSTGSGRSLSRYRQRYGRSGRVYVDRTLTGSEKDELGKTQLKGVLENPILGERWRFDPRVWEDERCVILDEFDIKYGCSFVFANLQSSFLSSKACPSTSTKLSNQC
jgi:hypothetical protein